MKNEAENISDLSNAVAVKTLGLYAISVFSSTETQIVTVGSITAPMTSLVNIFNTTNPASEIAVNFTISTYPIGSIGYELTKSSEATNTQGLADVQLRLGNIPSEYGVTATCESCIPEASSVTFNCCGKLQTDEFRQGDEPWADQQLGTNSPHYLIRQTGCALTSVANMINFYANISTSIARTNPEQLNEVMISSNIYNNDDDVLWDMVPVLTEGVQFTDLIEVDNNHSLTAVINVIDEYLFRGLPVMIHALRANGRDHFMLAIGKCGDRYIVADPGSSTGRILYDSNDSQLLLQGVRLYELF